MTTEPCPIRFLRRGAEAQLHQEQAYQSDPVNPSIAVGLAAEMLFFRQYEQSIEACGKALELEPGFPLAYRWMGEALLLLEKYEEAISALRAVAVPTLAAGYLGYCYARTGHIDEARAMAAGLEPLPEGSPPLAYQIAILQLGLGNEARVFASLTQACEARSFGITWLDFDPIWDPIRDDPRFSLLLERMNLGGDP